ncbi:MAG: hypothetical protein ACPHCN_12090 [Mycobacterium sp.]
MSGHYRPLSAEQLADLSMALECIHAAFRESQGWGQTKNSRLSVALREASEAARELAADMVVRDMGRATR